MGPSASASDDLGNENATIFGTSLYEPLNPVEFLALHEISQKRARNALIPISRLPPEVLAEIFMHWSNEWRAQSADQHTPRCAPRNGWIRISHVSHHWREVSLQFPKLWCEFQADRAAFTEEILRRSKQALLRIAVHLEQADPLAVQLVLSQIYRMQSISVHRYHPDLLVACRVGPDAPYLRDIRIDMWRAEINQGVHSTIFDNMATPRLTRLELRGNPHPWLLSLLRPTLTHLTLKSLLPDATITMHQVLTVIGTLTTLQALALEGVLPLHASAPALHVRQSIHLPCLRHLRLRGSAPSSSSFIQCVRFPGSTSIRVETVDSITQQTLEFLLSTIAFRLRNANSKEPDQPLVSLDLSEQSLRGWRFDYGLPFFISRNRSSFRRPPIVEISSPLDPSPSLLRAVFSSIPVHDVTSLTIGVYTFPIPEADWEQILVNLPHLRYMAVDESSSHSLANALVKNILNIDMARERGDDDVELVLPALEVLMLSIDGATELSADSVVTRYRHIIAKRGAFTNVISKLLLHNGRSVESLSLQEPTEWSSDTT